MVSRRADLCLFIRVGMGVYVSMRSGSTVRRKLFVTLRKMSTLTMDYHYRASQVRIDKVKIEH